MFLEADDIVDRMRDVRERCEADGRDPATMRFSLYERDERTATRARHVDRLARFAEIGLDRLIAFPTRWSPTLDAQAAFAEDCRAAESACRRRRRQSAPRASRATPRSRPHRRRHWRSSLTISCRSPMAGTVLIDRWRRGLVRRFDVVTEVERLAGQEGDPLGRDLTLGQGLEPGQVGLLEQVQVHAHARKRQDVEVGPGRDIRPEGEDHETTREHGLDLRGMKPAISGFPAPAAMICSRSPDCRSILVQPAGSVIAKPCSGTSMRPVVARLLSRARPTLRMMGSRSRRMARGSPVRPESAPTWRPTYRRAARLNVRECAAERERQAARARRSHGGWFLPRGRIGRCHRTVGGSVSSTARRSGPADPMQGTVAEPDPPTRSATGTGP